MKPQKHINLEMNYELRLGPGKRMRKIKLYIAHFASWILNRLCSFTLIMELIEKPEKREEKWIRKSKN